MIKQSVQLFSTGLDSVIIKALYNPDVLLYFHLGTKEADKEADIARFKYGAEIDHRFKLNDQVLSNNILPLRNLFLIAGACYYGNDIYFGSTAGDTTRDKDATFLSQTAELLGHVLYTRPEKTLPWFVENRPRIIAPLETLTKTEAVRRYLEQGHNPQELIDSWSCYGNGGIECGYCRSCQRKFVALANNGIRGNFATQPDLTKALLYANQANRNQREIQEIKQCLDAL